MNDPENKLSLIQSLRWSVQWAVAIILRHQGIVAAYAAAGVAIGLLEALVLGPSLILMILYSVAIIPLALLTHSEVLRGPSALDAATLGQGPGRMLGYLSDSLLMGLAAMLLAMIPVLLIWIVTSGGAPLSVSGGLEVVIFVSVLAAFVIAFCRPALRLPSRIFGPPISWARAWHMGQGNTLPLVLGFFLVSLPLSIIEQVLDWLLPQVLSTPLGMLLLPAQIILTCAFLSVAYGRLRDANLED